MRPTTEESTGIDALLSAKKQAKQTLLTHIGWHAEGRKALLCIPTAVSDAQGGTVLTEILPGLLTLPLRILVLGKGSAAYGTMLTELAKREPTRVAIIPNTETAVHAMELASDMALFLKNPAGSQALADCLRNGAVPIAPACAGLENYDQNQETGTAFLYEEETRWHAFAAVVRAVETYRFPYDWKTIQRHGLEDDER